MKDFLNKFFDWTANIPQDKLVHFVAGCLLSLIFIALQFDAFWWWVFAVAFSKELYDALFRTGFDVYDLLATSLAPLLIGACILLF